MKLVVVAGAKSNVGKTFVAQKLLSGLPSWSAVKITTIKGSGCPRRVSDCDVCKGLSGDFEIIKDEDIINQEGTDTGRLKKAGAKQVIWLRSSLKGLKSGINHALRELKGSLGVVIEGTSVLKHIRPDLVIFLENRNKKNIKINCKKEKSGWIKDVLGLLEENV